MKFENLLKIYFDPKTKNYSDIKYALEKSKDPNATTLIMKALEKTNIPKKKGGLLYLLRQRQAIHPEVPPNHMLVPLILKYLKSKDPWIRFTAVDALAAFPDKRAIKPLLNIVNNHRERIGMRSTAIGTLGVTGYRKGISLYLKGLTSRNYSMRFESIGALSHIRFNDKKAIPRLRKRILIEKEVCVKNYIELLIYFIEQGYPPDFPDCLMEYLHNGPPKLPSPSK